MGKEKIKYYSIRNLIKAIPDAHYYVVWGERSNGKTYSTLDFMTEDYFKNGHKFALIRRYKEDFRSKRAKSMFNGIVQNHLIEKYSKGKWNSVYYYAQQWFFMKVDMKTKERVIDDEPFAYCFSISDSEHDKSTAYPDVYNILFDEFITRDSYLNDEFVEFENLLSTIIRLRTGVKIFMLGNTINPYNPYFKEMGLTNAKNMNVGSRDVYTYGDSGLRVACEFSDMPNKDKASNVYFAFNNPKLNMITGKNGVWEIAIYPHLTKEMKYDITNVIYRYYVEWENDLLECEIVRKDDMSFTFVHNKTTPIREDNTNIVFSTIHNPKPNYRRKITKSIDNIGEIIIYFFQTEKVFYQSNECGEIMRNYIQWCKQTKIEY